MSKKSTPKKQRSHAQTMRQYKTFQNKTRKRLAGAAAFAPCPNCGEKRLPHHACPSCGKYKGRDTINKEKLVEKITKVKA
jgi:large subunit ribosomal protein L32